MNNYNKNDNLTKIVAEKEKVKIDENKLPTLIDNENKSNLKNEIKTNEKPKLDGD